jgi:hypothetical protein
MGRDHARVCIWVIIQDTCWRPIAHAHMLEVPKEKLIFLPRHSDFIHGLPTSTLPAISANVGAGPLTPADRLRLIYTYITSMHSDGGLGIIPGSKEWDHVVSVLGLHDRTFNDLWITSWTTRRIAPVKLERIREQVPVTSHQSDVIN